MKNYTNLSETSAEKIPSNYQKVLVDEGEFVEQKKELWEGFKIPDNAETLALFMKDERFLEYMKKAHSLKHEKREVLYNYIDFLFSTNR